jgi:O-antigen ligase
MLGEKAIRLIPALTFAAALLLMVNQSYVKVFEAIGRARFLPALLMCGIGALWVIQNRQLPRRARWFDWCAIAFLAFALTSSLWALDWRLSLGRAISLTASYTAVFWVMWIEVSRHGPRRILSALMAAIAIVMVLNLVSIPIVPEGAFWAYLRYQGIMNNPNALGALVALTLPLALWFAQRRGGRGAWALVALMFATAQLTQSRTTAIAGLVGAGYYLFHARPERRLRLAGLGALYLALTILLPQATFAYQEYTDRRTTKIELERRFRDAVTELKAAEQKAAQDKLAAAGAKAQPVKPAPPPVAAPAPKPAPPIKPVEAPPAPPPAPVVPPARRTPPKPDLPIEVEEALKRYNELKEAVDYAQRPAAPDLVDPLKNPRNMHLATFSGRTIAWQLGLRYLSECPLTGFGFGNEELVLPTHGVEEGFWTFTGYYFHNSYLGLAVQVGVIGALVFYLPLVALALAEWRTPGRLDEGALRYALRGVLFTGLVVATFESWIYAMGNAHAFPFWTSVMLLTWIRTAEDGHPLGGSL